MKRIALFTAITLTSASVSAADQYRAVFSDDLSIVTVEACFEGSAPASLHRHEEVDDFVQWVRIDDRSISESARWGRMPLPRMAPDSCIQWQIDLSQAAESNRRLAIRFDESLVVYGNLWFWRDDENRDLEIEIVAPLNMSFSSPWRPLEGAGKNRYLPLPTPAQWSSRIAVGRFPLQHIPVPGTELTMAAVGSLSDRQREHFAQWIGESARSVASVYGEFPQQYTQVLVVPIGKQNSAVPYAHVIRGGGTAVEFFIDETRPLAEFLKDWTATHELSHLLLPFVASKDRWLSEGMASYYQNILRARDGRLTEKQAWSRLNSGFERGRAATRDGESLATATQSGWNSTMRVYWGGAAIMLKADTRLRALSDGQHSLDTALADFYNCCFDTTRSWRARDLFADLDRLTGHDVFLDLYRQHVPETKFPDLDETYDLLGIKPGRWRLQLDSDAPWSPIRQSIMGNKESG